MRTITVLAIGRCDFVVTPEIEHNDEFLVAGRFYKARQWENSLQTYLSQVDENRLEGTPTPAEFDFSGLTPRKIIFNYGGDLLEKELYVGDDMGFDPETQMWHKPHDMTGYVRLDNGQWLYNWHGKYAPGISLLLEKLMEPHWLWKSISSSELNLEGGKLSYIEGDFWISKKGSNCFRPKANGSHWLLCDAWGGAFNKYRGNNLRLLPNLYFRRASSNGGGNGNDYCIIKKGDKYTMSVEDI